MKCKNEDCKFVSKKQAKKMRKGLHQLLMDTMKDLKEESYAGFSYRIVGSSKRNMIIQRGKSVYDTDLQIEYSESKKKSIKPIPNDFKGIFYDKLKSNLPDGWTIQISTSVITINKINNNKLEHYFDIAITRTKNQQREIAKGKNPDDSSDDKFIWNQLKGMNSAYIDFKNMDHADVKKVKQEYINRKCETKDVDKDDPNYRMSSEIFVETVNNVK